MIDVARGTRGALAGCAAAAVWAAQQPLDKRVFGSAYDDVELLGKALVRGPAWPAVGLAMHLANGAAFGFVYAQVARRAPAPPVVRGLAAAMAENFGLWPLVAVTDRFHPARDELPRLGGDRRALAQATWRHALFGVVLGAVEERLNGAARRGGTFGGGVRGSAEVPVGSNGHGDLEAAARARVASA